MLSIDRFCLSHPDSTFARPQFADLTVHVDNKQCLAVTGPNGAGKSTLLRCIAGLRLPESGTITVDGVAADDSDSRFRSLVALELGDDAVFAELTVAEHLRLLSRAHATDLGHSDAILADAGIAALADRFPHTLSAGQRQKFALCAVFLRPAALVVIDEPESGLDDVGRSWLIRQILRVTASGASVVIATHSADLVDECADATLVIGG